eukprot:GHUV01051705.1.p1 GENE.GHUV01051705.1~~GHUV01051705.1.p1  ORF type:complete len:103 (+),score=11.78 GHUV01051705.1:1285-1593(+)
MNAAPVADCDRPAIDVFILLRQGPLIGWCNPEPQQVSALVNIIIIDELTPGMQSSVVVQQLNLPRLQHVVQTKFIACSELVEQRHCLILIWCKTGHFCMALA